MVSAWTSPSCWHWKDWTSLKLPRMFQVLPGTSRQHQEFQAELLPGFSRQGHLFLDGGDKFIKEFVYQKICDDSQGKHWTNVLPLAQLGMLIFQGSWISFLPGSSYLCLVGVTIARSNCSLKNGVTVLKFGWKLDSLVSVVSMSSPTNGGGILWEYKGVKAALIWLDTWVTLVFLYFSHAQFAHFHSS